MQAVVDCRPRGAGIVAVDRLADFLDCRMPGMLQKVLEYRIPLRRTTETVPPEGARDFRRDRIHIQS